MNTITYSLIMIVVLMLMTGILLPLIFQMTYYMVRGRRKLCSSNIAAETYPEITIIVPIRNENLDTILGLIDNILKLNYPKEYFEVIIVSDDAVSYTHLTLPTICSV